MSESSRLGGRNIEPDTWSECINYLLSSGGDSTIYRGHRCYAWNLESTLERALQEHAQQWDERKYGVMQSMSADPETDEWAANIRGGPDASLPAECDAFQCF